LPRAPDAPYRVKGDIPEPFVARWTSVERAAGGQLRLLQGSVGDAWLLDPATLALTRERTTPALCPGGGPVKASKAPTALCGRGAPVLVLAGTSSLLVEREGQKRSLSPGFPVVAAALSPDGEAVAATSGGGHVLVWSTRDGRVLQERSERPDQEPVRGLSWPGRDALALIGNPTRIVSLRDGSETALHCALFPARPVDARVSCAVWSGDRLDGEARVFDGVTAAEGTEPAPRALQGPKRQRGLLRERLGEVVAPGSVDPKARRELLVRAFRATLEERRVAKETPHGAFALLDVEEGQPGRFAVGELGARWLDAQARVARDDLDFTGDGIPDLLVQDRDALVLLRSEGPGEFEQRVSRFNEERFESIRPVDLLPLTSAPGFVIETQRGREHLIWLYARNSVSQGASIEGGVFPETSPLPGGRTGTCEQSRSGANGFEWTLSFRVTAGRIHEFRSHLHQVTGPGQPLVEQSYLPFVGGDASSGKRLKLVTRVSGQSSRTTLFDISFQGNQFTVAGHPGTGTCKWTP
jgi:hypothetical protein